MPEADLSDIVRNHLRGVEIIYREWESHEIVYRDGDREVLEDLSKIVKAS